MQGLFNRDGVFYARFTHNGIRYWKSLKTKDKRLAIAMLKRYKAEVILGGGDKVKDTKKPVTIQAILDQYELKKKSEVSEGHFDNIIRYLIEFSDGVKWKTFEDVNLTQCYEWLLHLKEKKSNTAKSIQQHIKAAFKLAVQLGMIPNNPLDAMPSLRHTSKTKEPLTKEQFHKFAQAARFHNCWPLLMFLMKTGCRFSEGALLTWKAVDLKNRKIRLWSSTTKTKQSREILIQKDLYSVLKRLSKNAKDNELVFPNNTGQPFDKSNVNRTIKTFSNSIGRPDISPHTLRHTYINLALDSGVDLYTIQQWVGHASIKTTEVYLKSNSLRLAKAAEATPDLLGVVG